MRRPLVTVREAEGATAGVTSNASAGFIVTVPSH
jgi:hypothetical protein